MPNGGSDNCGTCCFNSINKGRTGLPKNFGYGLRKGKEHCLVRDVDIPSPFYTYCANHPYHNPAKIDVPVGPVYVHDDHSGIRKIWIESPDTEEVRRKLIELLESLSDVPTDNIDHEYFNKEIIKQIGEFEDRRAVPGLRRVMAFDPGAAPEGDNPFNILGIQYVALAIENLAKILKDEFLEELEICITKGVDPTAKGTKYEPGRDKFVMIRYFALKGLENCSTNRAIDLLETAAADPHEEIRKLALRLAPEKFLKAVGKGQTTTVENLLSFGIDANAQNEFGQSPLHLAA